MSALFHLLSLPEEEKAARGLIHTPAEIAQQPTTWEATFRYFQTHHAEIRDFLLSAGIGGNAPCTRTVYLIGAGTSDYIGRSLLYLLSRLWQCEVIAIPSTDLATHFDQCVVPGRSYLWISFSRSGTSAETAAVLERALQTRPDIRHIVVSCNASGRMLRDSVGKKQVLSICLDDTVNDRGLAMTSSFSNMLVFGQCLAHVESAGKYETILGQMIEAGNTFMDVAAETAAQLAKCQDRYNKACFVGSGPMHGVARESALKLLELTAGRVLTMSESALGLRHGPMAALDQDTLLTCFLSGDPRIQKFEIDLLEEISRKNLVRTCVVIAGTSSPRLAAVADHILTPGTGSQIHDDYRPPVDVIFGQLLGLFFSINLGLKPDCPSPNGAISRVVDNVSIYY